MCKGDQGDEAVWGTGGEYMSQWDYYVGSPSPCGLAGTGLLLAGLKATPVVVLGIAKI